MKNDKPTLSIAQSISLDVAAEFQKATALHQRGLLPQAHDLYEKILEIEPMHAGAWHLSGVIAAQTKNYVFAVQRIGKAISIASHDAAAHCNMGSALRELNQWDAALASYDQAIALNSNYVEAYFNRGIVLAKLKRVDAAIDSYDSAITLKPDFAIAHLNRGLALRELNQLQSALVSYDKAIALKANYADAHFNRGNVLHELHQLDAAMASYNAAISIRQDFAEAYCNRANVMNALGQHEAAVGNYDQAIAIKPDYAMAYFNRGVALRKLDKLDGALASFDRAIAANKDFAEAYCERGAVLKELHQLDAARASCDKAIEIKNDFAEAYLNRGNVLVELDQFDAALVNFDQAIAIRADCATAYSNRGYVYLRLNRLDEALANYDRAVAIDPFDADTHHNRSHALLLHGEFAAGWIEHEWRWKAKRTLLRKERRNFRQPLWLGQESISRKTVLIYMEQGLGDTLHFCRYVKMVSELGARVILETHEALVSLMSNLEGVSQVVTRGSTLPQFDYRCPLLSLPLAFKTTLDSIPSPSKYLNSDATKVEQWKTRFVDKTRPLIGLVWSGRNTHPNDRNRSIRFADFIRHLPGHFQYVNLQQDVREVDQAELESNSHVLNFTSELKDFSDTAALCECLDLVVSVDTSVAHLCGGLGRRTWILLPFSPDWRWLLDRDDSPWYSHVKLYRQEQAGDWDGVLNRVSNELRHAFNNG